MDYSLIFRNHVAVQLLVDPQTGRITDANDAAVQFYGYSYADLTAMQINEISLFDDAVVHQNMQRPNAGVPDYFEFWHRLASGEVKPVDVWTTRIPMPEGAILHSIVIDASHKRQLDQKYHALFQQSNDAIFILDLEGRHLDVNQRASDMLGYSRNELLTMSFRELVSAGDHINSQEQRYRLIAGEQLAPYERTFRHQHGHLIPTEINAELVCDARGEPQFIQSIVRDISARKQAEKNTHRIQERLRMTLEATRSGTWEWNVLTGETVFNERWAEIVGYTLDELQPISIQTWIDLIHPDDLQESNRLLEIHFAGDTPYYELEVRMKHKDGHWVWVVDRGMVMEWTQEGDPLWMFGTHNDITERKSTENQLRTSLERLYTIVDNIPIMISFFNEKGQFEFSNHYWNESLGWTAGELAQLDDPLVLFYPDDAYRQQVLEYMLQTKVGWRTFKTQTRHHGMRLTSWANIKLSDGRSIGIGQDVTETAMMEERLRLRERALEATPHGVVIADASQPDMPIVYANPSFEVITGYSNEDIVGKNCRFLQGQDQDQEGLRTIRAAIKAEAPCSVVLRNYRQDGSLFWNDLSIAPILDEAGNVTHFVGIQQDITEQKKAEEQAIAYTLEKERVNILTGFIRDASHEFRTPLTVIQSSLYILSKTDNPQKRQEKTSAIYAQVERLTKLLDMLVSMSKLDSGIKLVPHRVHLQTLIQGLLDEWHDFIKEKNLSVIRELASNPVMVVDILLLQEAFTQVFENAIQHTPPGGQVIIRAVTQDDRLLMDIENDGDPIPEESLPHIFERFYRQDDAHTTAGIGLGLSIAQSVIEKHGGHIEITNREEGGCRARIDLPLNAP